MKDLLAKFESQKPEIVFEWSDAETEAEGWVVINSLRGGAAGGGTRMRVGLDKKEVIALLTTELRSWRETSTVSQLLEEALLHL